MLKEYFRLRQDRRVSNAIKALDLPPGYTIKLTKEGFDGLETAVIARYDEHSMCEFPDFLFSPAFMVSVPVQRLFEDLVPEMKFKAVQFLPQDSTRQDWFRPLYWLTWLSPTDSLHEATSFLGTGLIEHLVLDRDKVGHQHILHMTLAAEEVWVLSLTAVEKLLAKRPFGMKFEKVEMR